MCKFCGQQFFAKDSKAKICSTCRNSHMCKCGCGQTVKGSTTYIRGHKTKGKTYKDIYGDKNVRCGFKSGDQNIAKHQDIREKISIGVKKSYENTLYYEKKYKQLEKVRCQSVLHSKISQSLFWQIFNKLNDDDKNHCYFSELNKEFAKSGVDCINKFQFSYDFALTNKKKIIEFNGSYWHMNPDNFSPEDINEVTHLTAEQTWLKDKEKINFINKYGFETLIIWDTEFKQSESLTINRCLTFLNY